MIFVKLFYFILLVGGGTLILKYRKTVKSWTGNFYWAEKYIGNGGTYFVIILIGAGMIFVGFSYLFGGFENLFNNNQIITGE